MKKPETNYVAKLRRALKEEFGGYWYKNHGSMFSEPGLPDLTGIVGGIYVGIEAKVQKNTTSTVQKEVLRKIRINGGVGITSRSIERTIGRLKKALEVSKGMRIVYVEKKSIVPRNGNGYRQNTYDISESPETSRHRKRR